MPIHVFSQSLIISQLEYATIIWESQNIGHSNLIEDIQNNVLIDTSVTNVILKGLHILDIIIF